MPARRSVKRSAKRSKRRKSAKRSYRRKSARKSAKKSSRRSRKRCPSGSRRVGSRCVKRRKSSKKGSRRKSAKKSSRRKSSRRKSSKKGSRRKSAKGRKGPCSGLRKPSCFAKKNDGGSRICRWSYNSNNCQIMPKKFRERGSAYMKTLKLGSARPASVGKLDLGKYRDLEARLGLGSPRRGVEL